MELAEFCYNNLEHLVTGPTPFQMVMSKSLIIRRIRAMNGQPLSNASEEVPMVMQLDEKR